MITKILDYFQGYMDEAGGESGGGGEAASTETTSGDSSVVDTPTDDSVPETEATPAEVASPPPTEPAEFSWDDHMDKTLKTKINGVEGEVSLAKMIEEFQKGEASNSKFEEASKQSKQTMQIIQGLKDNTADALSKLGVDPNEWAYNYLNDQVKLSEETPEQKELRELRDYRENQEITQKQQQEQQAAMEQEARNNSAIEKMQTEAIEAIEKYGLHKDPTTARQIGSYMQAALDQGRDMSVDQAARLVSQDHKALVKSVLGGLKGDDILNFAGEELVEKLRKADLDRLKTKESQENSSPATSAPRTDEDRFKGLDFKAINRLLREDEGL